MFICSNIFGQCSKPKLVNLEGSMAFVFFGLAFWKFALFPTSSCLFLEINLSYVGTFLE